MSLVKPAKSIRKAVSATAAGVAIAAAALTTPTANAQQAPEITWEQCPVHVSAPNTQCGRIEVPMRYDDPDGQKISVGFLKRSAANPAARRGTIFGNPGGPGGDTYMYFGTALEWPEEITNEWDLVTVQSRGLPHSTPLECEVPEPQNPIDAAKIQVDANLSHGGFMRSICQGDKPGYPETITTENHARDWEMVRQALGQERISIIGLSYGTILGSAYATMYPQHTDRVVLDSAADPNTQWQQLLADQIGGFERALHDYFAWVAANEATFGMGDTPLKAYQHWYNAVAAEAGTNPTVTPPPARIGDLPPGLEFTGQAGADAMTATGKARVEGEGIISRTLNPGSNQINSPLLQNTIGMLPRPEMWGIIAGLTNGTVSPDDLKGDRELTPAEIEEAQAQMQGIELLQRAQLCNENVTPPVYTLLPELFWSQATGNLFTLPYSFIASGAYCSGAGPVAGVAPMDGSQLQTRPLQFNGTGDPQTVYAGRHTIANAMNSHLVTVHGPGHGHVAFGNDAVDRQVVNYLRTGELGPVDQPGYFDQ